MSGSLIYILIDYYSESIKSKSPDATGYPEPHTLLLTTFVYTVPCMIRCKVCSCEMLFSLRTIRKHVKSAHSLSLQLYRARHKGFTGQS